MAKNAKPKIQADAAYDIQPATEELALPNREDIPGITKLTAGWREPESMLKDLLRHADGQYPPSPETMAVM